MLSVFCSASVRCAGRGGEATWCVFSSTCSSSSSSHHSHVAPFCSSSGEAPAVLVAGAPRVPRHRAPAVPCLSPAVPCCSASPQRFLLPLRPFTLNGSLQDYGRVYFCELPVVQSPRMPVSLSRSHTASSSSSSPCRPVKHTFTPHNAGAATPPWPRPLLIRHASWEMLFSKSSVGSRDKQDVPQQAVE